MLDIKSEAELRHVLVHFSYAIRALADGCPRLALYELDSVAEMFLWADDSNEAIEADLAKRGVRDEEEGKEGLQGQREELQGKEELQGEGQEEEEIARIASCSSCGSSFTVVG